MVACSLFGAAALISSTICAEGGFGRPGGAVGGGRRKIDRAGGAVAERIADVGQQRAGQDPRPVVEDAQARVAGKGEDVVAGADVLLPPTSKPANPSEAAVVPVPTS